MLSWLERTFPNELPKIPQTTTEEVNARIGEQRVLRKLRDVHRRQTESALEGTL
jgi:hypothetical protein